MKTVVLLLLLVYDASAVTHSLKFFETASSGVPNFPEYVNVAVVDGVEVMHYDSNTDKVKPKQDWMDKATADDPDIWESETQRSTMNQKDLKVDIEIAKQRLNQTGGVPWVQWMYGCEWDDETNETDTFYHYTFDGEDFLSWDLRTLKCVAEKPKADFFAQDWNKDKGFLDYNEHFFNVTCIELLKKHVDAGGSSLPRTERPSVWFLQRTPSSPVSCFATGFFPEKKAMIFWKKDRQKLNEGVDIGEVLPNHDGTFQISANLTLPDNATDLHKYECVLKLSGLEEELGYTLDAHSIKTNHKNPSDTIIITVVAVVVLALAFIAVMLYKMMKKKNGESVLLFKVVNV